MPSIRLPFCTLASHRIPIAHFPRRTFVTTPTRWMADSQLQDKDALNPIKSEYSKSGGDDAAAHEKGAFDPNTTKPEQQKSDAASGPGGDSESPLQVSPGNPEVSKSPPAEEGGAQRSQSESQGERRKVSGAGSGKKDGGGKSG